MIALHLVLAFALSGPVFGQPSTADVASGVRDEKGLQQLVVMAFGGGHHYAVSDSPFHIAQLMPTSGLYTTELFVFESRPHNSKSAWKVRFLVAPAAAAHGG